MALITDYRIVSRPYRGAKRFMVMRNGFVSREQAEQYLQQGQQGGWLSPDAFVRSQKVREVVPVDHTVDIRAAAAASGTGGCDN